MMDDAKPLNQNEKDSLSRGGFDIEKREVDREKDFGNYQLKEWSDGTIEMYFVRQKRTHYFKPDVIHEIATWIHNSEIYGP